MRKKNETLETSCTECRSSALIMGELKLKLISMSVEVEKINLCRLKIDETFNLCGKNVCIILARSCNMDKIVGNCKCQVSLSTWSVCVFVCIFISVCGHRSHKAVAWPHRFHALFSHLFTTPFRLTSFLPGPPPSLLLRCPWRWFTSASSS